MKRCVIIGGAQIINYDKIKEHLNKEMCIRDRYQCIKVDYMNISVREILRCVQERLASDSLVPVSYTHL